MTFLFMNLYSCGTLVRARCVSEEIRKNELWYEIRKNYIYKFFYVYLYRIHYFPHCFYNSSIHSIELSKYWFGLLLLRWRILVQRELLESIIHLHKTTVYFIISGKWKNYKKILQTCTMIFASSVFEIFALSII